MKNWWVPGCTIGYEHTFINGLADFLASLEGGKPVQPDFRSGAVEHAEGLRRGAGQRQERQVGGDRLGLRPRFSDCCVAVGAMPIASQRTHVPKPNQHHAARLGHGVMGLKLLKARPNRR